MTAPAGFPSAFALGFPAPFPTGFPAALPSGFPSALAEGCIPTVFLAFPQRVSRRLQIPLALARGLPQPRQRLPPTVREGCIPTVPPAPSPADFPSRPREGYRSRTAAATDSSRGPNCAGFNPSLGQRLHPTRAPSRPANPCPPNTHPNPKPQFEEMNRNPPRANRAAREQPEGLRLSGQNTTSPTFRHPPLAPQARPVRRKPQRVSPRARARAASQLCRPRPPPGFPLALAQGPNCAPSPGMKKTARRNAAGRFPLR